MVSRFVDPFREFFLVSLYHSLSIVHKFVTFADVKKRQVRMAQQSLCSSRGKVMPPYEGYSWYPYIFYQDS